MGLCFCCDRAKSDENKLRLGYQLNRLRRKDTRAAHIALSRPPVGRYYFAVQRALARSWRAAPKHHEKLRAQQMGSMLDGIAASTDAQATVEHVEKHTHRNWEYE